MTTGGGACAPEQVALAKALADLLENAYGLGAREIRRVYTVGGESGSGKTVTANCLARELTGRGHDAGILHQDDYFHLPPATNHANRVRDLATVGPHEVDLARLRSHVDAFRAATNGVAVPAVDYSGNRFESRQRDFAGIRVLIVEGTYVVANVPADVRIFLTATSDDTRDRRMERNRDINAPIVDQVLAIEHPIIAAQAARADILIDRDFRITRRTR